MKFQHRFICLYLAAILFLSACGGTLPTPAPETEFAPTAAAEDKLTPIDLQAGYGVRGSWFELYFTNPASPISPQGTGGVDGPLVAGDRCGAPQYRCRRV
jgi:hypothetical protein